MKRFVIYTFAFLFLSIQAFSQGNLKKQAEQALKANEYTFALNNYKSLFSLIENEDPEKAKVAYEIGYCYRKISEPLHAQLWLQKAIDLKYEYPIVYLYCADAQRMNEKFDDAIATYQQYRTLVPGDKRGKEGMESCNTAKKWLQNPTNYKVTNLAYLNTESSDYSPFFLFDSISNSLYFSSSRDNANGDKIHGGSGQNFCDLFSSAEDAKGAWSVPVSISELINSPQDEGTPSLTKDGKLLFYTQCEYGEKRNHCQIMSSTKIGASWGEPNMLRFPGSDTSDYVHPSISGDGLTLYFASDRVGGYGGYDIWYCSRENDKEKWGKPKNAGQTINTKGDELFPYYRSSDSSLYFASNGFIGMGGLDIYRVNYDDKGKQYVLNLMSPINSSSDDFGITFRDSLEEGYFSSNRPGGKGYDDIYYFSIAKLHFSVKGQVINDLTGDPVPNAVVSLIGSDGSSLEVKSDKNGYYQYPLNPQANYVLLATHEGYLNSKYKISTYGRTENKDYEANIYLTLLDYPIEVPNVLYDVNLWNLRPESIVSLNKLYETLEDNPNIAIELSSHTDYRVGSRMSNEELSQLRAQSVVDFLISKGIDKGRLIAKGYGASKPKVIDMRYAELYDFLPIGVTLTPDFIKKLPLEQQAVCHQINRRTEFRVISANYKKQ